jgi:hypothetical protein
MQSVRFARADELQANGCLVITVPGADDGGLSGHEGIMDDANATLADMVADGTIAAEERARMVPRQSTLSLQRS